MGEPSLDALPRRGDRIGGRYEIDAVLGRGGFGAVYAARHVRSGRRVAVKWLLPQVASDAEALERFMVEARATATIEHPNVVTIIDVDEEEGSPYIVMEMLRGESLRERIDRAGPLPPEEAVRWLSQAARGVAGAHQEGVVHRDLKPDNIFLCEAKDGTPREAKVLDFGISKVTHADTGPKTQSGVVIGTPAYMSPEQLQAPKSAHPTFDVYAIGVVLYEALTGVPPYRSESIYDLINQIGWGQAPPPSQLAPWVSPELDALVLRAMNRDPAHRPTSMSALVHELEAVARFESGVAFDPPTLDEAMPHPVVSSSVSGVRPSRPDAISGTGPTVPMATPQPGSAPLPTPPPSQVSTAVTPTRSRLPLVAAVAVALVVGAGLAVSLPLGLFTEPPPPAPSPAAQPVATVPPPEPLEAPPAEPAPIADATALAEASPGAPVALRAVVFHALTDERAVLALAVEGCGTDACPVHVALPDDAIAPRPGTGVVVEGARAGSHTYEAASGERSVPSVVGSALRRDATAAAEIPDAVRPVDPRAADPRAGRPTPRRPRAASSPSPALPSRIAPRMSDEEI